MSKTKGNVIDPIEIVKTYGTDAVRFTLASMASPGTDIAFNVARTEGYRAFANKIWNAARFIFMNVDRAAEIGNPVDNKRLARLADLAVLRDDPPEERWIVARLYRTVSRVNRSLEACRFDDAASFIYQFFWGDFCDWYLEIVKLRLYFSDTADKAKTKAALTTLVSVFEAALRLLSPFMPFITEEIWQAIFEGHPPAKSIALSRYPEDRWGAESSWEEWEVSWHLLQTLIGDIRAQRKERGVPEKESAPVLVCFLPIEERVKFIMDNADIIMPLAKVSRLDRVDHEVLDNRPGVKNSSLWSLDVVYEKQIDVPAERARLTKDIEKYEKGVASAERQLGNEGFLAKAPAKVVEGLKKQEAETRLLLEKARAALDVLSKG
jgi:valyl-tRNA synthetase